MCFMQPGKQAEQRDDRLASLRCTLRRKGKDPAVNTGSLLSGRNWTAWVVHTYPFPVAAVPAEVTASNPTQRSVPTQLTLT